MQGRAQEPTAGGPFGYNKLRLRAVPAVTEIDPSPRPAWPGTRLTTITPDIFWISRVGARVLVFFSGLYPWVAAMDIIIITVLAFRTPDIASDTL